MRIIMSINEPIRDKYLSYAKRWNSYDNGLILCWEIGRKQAMENFELAEKALSNELPSLVWDGGHKKTLKSSNIKYGSFNYLAMWQGLRGNDLDIDLDRDEGLELICSATAMHTIFTSNIDKFKNQ